MKSKFTSFNKDYVLNITKIVLSIFYGQLMTLWPDEVMKIVRSILFNMYHCIAIITVKSMKATLFDTQQI